MEKIDNYIKMDKVDKTRLKQSFMDACSNKDFYTYVSALPIEEDLLIKYTSTLMDAYEEYCHCRECKGLQECKNKVKGYMYTPTKSEKTINFSYIACPYEQKRLEDTKYQKNVIFYEIPKEVKNASLKNIYEEKQRLPIIKYFKQFLDHYEDDPKPKGVYLHGSFGCGKTYLVAALCNELAKRNVKSTIVYFPEFLRNLKSSFQSDYEEKFDSIRKAPILLLDDIGAENITSWSRDEILAPILQYRMDEHLPTFFTSNLTLNELETHLSNTSSGIELVKARRILERIKQLTVDLELISKNRRN